MVQIKGRSLVENATREIKVFYEQHGWKTYVHEGKISPKISIKSNPERFNGQISIFDPAALLSIAVEKLGYDRNLLSF